MDQWRTIDTAPEGVDVLCLDVRTGARAISSSDDRDTRRGFRHRNGFPATHWAPLLEPLPVDPYYGHPYPHIAKACLLIARDNGGINRNRSVVQALDFAEFIGGHHAPLEAIDAWLGTLSDEQLETVCCGEASEGAAILATGAPAGTNELLNDYFEMVC